MLDQTRAYSDKFTNRCSNLSKLRLALGLDIKSAHIARLLLACSDSRYEFQTRLFIRFIYIIEPEKSEDPIDGGGRSLVVTSML